MRPLVEVSGSYVEPEMEAGLIIYCPGPGRRLYCTFHVKMRIDSYILCYLRRPSRFSPLPRLKLRLELPRWFMLLAFTYRPSSGQTGG